MGVAEAEKQKLMLALYIFMTFGVFTKYRSYCLEDIHIPPCWGGGSWEESWEQCSDGVGKPEPACPQLWITDPPHPNALPKSPQEQSKTVKYIPACDNKRESNIIFTKKATK